MSKIREFLKTNVKYARPDDNLEKIVQILRENQISGVPIVDQDNKVIGIITARDLLKHSEKTKIIPLPYFPDGAPAYEYVLDNVVYKKSVEEFLETKVKEVMSKKVYTVKEDNTWHDAASLMKKKGINRIPVVDREGKLKGIVTRNDLLDFLSKHEEV